MCNEECYFGVLSKKDFKQSVHRMTKQLMGERCAFLQKTTLFSTWTKQSIDQMYYLWQEKTYNKGNVIYD